MYFESNRQYPNTNQSLFQFSKTKKGYQRSTFIPYGPQFTFINNQPPPQIAQRKQIIIGIDHAMTDKDHLVYNPQFSNVSIPITFASTSPIKNNNIKQGVIIREKKKIQSRPSSRNTNKSMTFVQNKEKQIYEDQFFENENNQLSKSQLESFSKTGQTFITNISNTTNINRLNVNSTLKKQSNLQSLANQKYSHLINPFQSDRDSSYYQVANVKRSQSDLTDTVYLIEQVDATNKIIENFQKQIVRLNIQLINSKTNEDKFRQQLNESKQFLQKLQSTNSKANRKKKDNFNQNQNSEAINIHYHKPNQKLLLEIQKMENDLKRKNQLIKYLEMQCKNNKQSYDEIEHKKSFLQKNNEEQTSQIKQIRYKHQEALKESNNQKKIVEILTKENQDLQRQKDFNDTKRKSKNNNQIEQLISSKLLERSKQFQLRERQLFIQLQDYSKQLNKYRGLYESQHFKIVEMAKANEVDRSEINVLLMKLQTYQTKLEYQTNVSNQINTKNTELEKNIKILQNKKEVLVIQVTNLVNQKIEQKNEVAVLFSKYQHTQNQIIIYKDLVNSQRQVKQKQANQFIIKQEILKRQNNIILKKLDQMNEKYFNFSYQNAKMIQENNQIKERLRQVNKIQEQNNFLTNHSKKLEAQLCQIQSTLSNKKKEPESMNQKIPEFLEAYQTAKNQTKHFKLCFESAKQQQSLLSYRINNLELLLNQCKEESKKILQESWNIKQEYIQKKITIQNEFQWKQKFEEEMKNLRQENKKSKLQVNLLLDIQKIYQQSLQREEMSIMALIQKQNQIKRLEIQINNKQVDMQSMSIELKLIQLQAETKDRQLIKSKAEYKLQLQAQINEIREEVVDNTNEIINSNETNQSKKAESKNQQTQILMKYKQQNLKILLQLKNKIQILKKQLVQQNGSEAKQFLDESQIELQLILQSRNTQIASLKLEIQRLNELISLKQQNHINILANLEQRCEQLSNYLFQLMNSSNGTTKNIQYPNQTEQPIVENAKLIKSENAKIQEIQTKYSQQIEYVQVDKNALIYISELLNIQIIDGQILSNIICRLESQQPFSSKVHAQLDQKQDSIKDKYSEVLDLFGVSIQGNQHNNLLTQIKSFRDNLKFIIEKVKQLQKKEENLIILNADLQIQRNLFAKRHEQLIHQISLMILLNEQITQEILNQSVRMANHKLQLRSYILMIGQELKSSKKKINNQQKYKLNLIMDISMQGEAINQDNISQRKIVNEQEKQKFVESNNIFYSQNYFSSKEYDIVVNMSQEKQQ